MHRLFATAIVGLALSVLPANPASAAIGSKDSAHKQQTPFSPHEVLRWRIDRAIAHYDNGEFREAERLLALVVDSGDDVPAPIMALVQFNRGAALLQLDRFEEAIEALSAAERLKFGHPAELFLARGLAWEHLNNKERAAADYVSALLADPGNRAIQRKIDTFFYKR